MNQDFHLIQENIKNIVSTNFSTNQKEILKEQINFINSYVNNLNKFIGQNDVRVEGLTDYNKKTASLIEKKFISNKLFHNFNEYFEHLVIILDDYINTFADSLIEIQSDERFEISGNDSYSIKNFKRIKRVFLDISQIPISIGNFTKKIFKKELKEKKNWKHIIPLKRIAFIVLRDRLFRALFPLIEEINQNIASSSHSILQIDKNINKMFLEDFIKRKEGYKELQFEFDNILKNINEKYELLDEKIAEIIEAVIKDLSESYEKTGTVELPGRKFSAKEIITSNKKLNEEFKSIDEGWQNTFFILFEDWRLNKELYIFYGRSELAYSNIKKETEKRIGSIVLSELQKILALLEYIKGEINEFYGSSNELLSLLYKEKEKILKQLSSKIIPSISEIILAQNIPELIGGIEINIEGLLQNISNKRAIIRAESYTRKIKTSEIDYISPKEMISFTSLKKFSKSIQGTKNNILRETQKVQDAIWDIDQISDFNLDTAISMFKSDERTGEDPLDIAAEGIERAAGKTNEIKNILLSIIKEIEETVGKAIKEFNSDLIKLTKTENILDIKIKIAKEKTLQRTTRLKEKSIRWIRNVIPVLKNSYEKGQGGYKDFYGLIRKKLGLTLKVEVISSEISDFLAATQTAVLKLPVVYRRLFEIEALKDERFFEGRKNELTMLNSAYNNWKRGGYAPVAIVGEKGSGATTLLNFFETGLETKYNIFRTEIYEVIYQQNDLVEFFKTLFKINSIKNLEELIRFLNNQPSKKIIIIENIQHLFLRKVNGFLCLKILFEIISKTQKNIFWISTSSLYSWEYLNKTLNITDYFGYVVRLRSLEDEQMINVILKRHKISGYNLNFKPSREEEENKGYLRIPDEKKQGYLSKQYFSDLNKFAKSNISLALLFWLRSTREVSGDTITIGSLRDIDFSFLSSLDTNKVFTLNSLLIHDGLTVESFSLVNNLPESQSRLMLLVLLDDGVIVQKNGLFKINPLLYRQTVTLLQTKNIIH